MIVKWTKLWPFLLLNIFCSTMITEFPRSRVEFYRDKVKSMFYHAYDNYLTHAYPRDELMPLTCKGVDTWGEFSLTLIDALDTLLIMGNETEFKRAVNLVLENANTDSNVNVSVFETNIRVVGGLLSAHIMSGRVQGMDRHSGWPCAGPLLDLAERFARKLLPAFNTETGMPYGTVNLRYGVNRYETPITCTAGVGTFIIEFGALSRLTGNPIYERVALRALKSLWKTRSSIGLVGNHINVNTGAWTATDAGIGAGVDSYFEYLAKGALLFHRPLLMQQFKEYETAINKHIRKDDWFTWVSMTKGQVNFPVFQSLEAFWPGVLALTGKVEDAARIMLTYDQVNRQYGLTPEFYNLPTREAVNKRSGYPLRPEMIESMMYLYKATDDPHYLHMAASVVEAIEFNSKTSCGYATIRDLNTKILEDRMESFFLSETTKYLYLIFDPQNFIHTDGTTARTITTPSGKCTIYGGGWIFNTEAHPIDPVQKRHSDETYMQNFKDTIDFVSLLDLEDPFLQSQLSSLDENDLPTEIRDLQEESHADVKEELQEYEKLWNSTENDANDDENSSNENQETTESEADTTKNEPVLNKQTTQPLVQTVEAVENKPQEQKRRRRKKKQSLISKDSKSETEERAKVKRELKGILDDLGISTTNKKQQSLLSELGSEYSGVLKATEKLQRIALSKDGTEIAKLKQKLKQKKKATKLAPINEFICPNCCVILDAEYDSVALRTMLNLIYSRHIYKQADLPFLPGPICRQSERPDPSVNYLSDIPRSFHHIFRALDALENENEELDGVERYSFATFAYRQLAAKYHDLLTSPPKSFESIVQGNGQVLIGPRY
ncbi:Alpha-1,2-Mannosidase [Aphelenchoides besseyi]|nr:Alpha-1,2-Mannosidase [Aphelenchoides besseyi]